MFIKLRVLLLLSLFIMLSALTYGHGTSPFFSDINDLEVQNFETEIAYFFGAKQPQKIAQHYLKALEELEKAPDKDKKKQKEMMHPYLVKAYKEVAYQTGLVFNAKKAARYEAKLILAQAAQDSTENIIEIMTDIYRVVFNTTNYRVRKAAMIRTYLYKYKIDVMRSGHTLSKEDKMMLIALSRESESILNRVIRSKQNVS